MAESRYSLPKATKKGAAEAEALNRQLLAVEADIQAGRLPEAAASLNQLVAAHPKDGRLYVAGWLLANKAGNVEAAYKSARNAVALRRIRLQDNVAADLVDLLITPPGAQHLGQVATEKIANDVSGRGGDGVCHGNSVV